MENIKCIDFASLGGLDDTPENEQWTKIAQEVVSAFNDIGFVYIKNHGISESLIKKIHETGEKFFALPQDVKQKYSKVVGQFQGYVEINREIFQKTDNIQELRESYDVRYPERNFPSEVDDFKQTVNNFTTEGIRFANKLLRCIELGLEGISEGAVRCGAHTDYGTFTLLFQDKIGGLEVKRRDGEWVKADPIPDTILVNVGDLLQMWTSGQLIATEHRVRVPKEEILRRCARKSVVLFFHPEHEVLVKPLDGTGIYPPVFAGQHLDNRYKTTYAF